MNTAIILKFIGSGVITTTANKSLLDTAKLLALSLLWSDENVSPERLVR